MIVSLITAAGIGSRTGLKTPKQFIHVNNKPIIVYTMEAFERHPKIDAIMVVTQTMWIKDIQDYAQIYGISKLKWVVTGGETGPISIYNGIHYLEKVLDEKDFVLIHDGDRCNVSKKIISENISIAQIYGSAVTVIPCYDAVFKRVNYLDATDTLQEPRNELYRIQTPYTYKMKQLLQAYKEYDKRGRTYSAPCLMIQEIGERIFFSTGAEDNIKITTIEDFDLFKALLYIKNNVQHE